MLTDQNAFFLGRQKTAVEHLFKAVFLNAPVWLDDGKSEIGRLQRYMRPGSTLIDIGANVGAYSRRMSKLVPSATIVAFEPQSLPRAIFTTAGFLRRASRIIVLPYALGESQGMIELSIPIKAKGNVGIGLAHVGNDADLSERFSVKKEVVPIMALDEVMKAFDLPPVSFIKIDIEGGELNALRGGRALLIRDYPAVLCEIDGREGRFDQGAHELWAFFMSLGYSAVSVVDDRPLAFEALETNTLFVHPSHHA